MYYSSPDSVTSFVVTVDSVDSSEASNLSVPALFNLMNASPHQNIAALRQITTAYGSVPAAAGDRYDRGAHV